MSSGRLLIIESNPGALIVARNILAREGYDVLTCGAADEGVKRAQIHVPQVVLLDAAYAEPEVLRDLSLVSDRMLPILLLVPKGMGAMLRETLSVAEFDGRLQIVEIVEKPFVATRLLAAVDKCISALRSSSDDEPLMSGRLGRLSPDQILQFADTIPATICCRFENGEQAIEIFLRNHSVVHARRPRSNVESFSETETRDLVFEVMRWTNGRFRMIADPIVPEEAEIAGTALGIAALLMEGMTRLDEWKRVFENFVTEENPISGWS
jgi:CheY-like chemotaxis protein